MMLMSLLMMLVAVAVGVRLQSRAAAVQDRDCVLLIHSTASRYLVRCHIAAFRAPLLSRQSCRLRQFSTRSKGGILEKPKLTMLISRIHPNLKNMAITRELPQLPVELLETYNEERIPFYHPARASTCIKQINRFSIMLKTESTLLQKIRYKQKNQHKSATWWRHVSGSQRVSLRLLEQLEGGIIPNLPTVE